MPPGSALQVNYPAAASLNLPGPRANPGKSPALAPQSRLLNVTSTNPPMPTFKQVAPKAPTDDPQATPPTVVSKSP